MTLTSTFPTNSPIDTALATLGHLVRRGRASSLTPGDLASMVALLDHDLREGGVDEDGLLRARLQMLWRAGRDETLTIDQFEAITSSIRKTLQKARGGVGVDLAHLGGEARRVGRFAVIDGGLTDSGAGRCNTPDHHERSL